MARQGKIARLPANIREELNHRLLDGESALKILTWLNGLPRVREILGEDFEGLAVTDANLSDWRKGGFAEWEKRRGRVERTRELARYAAEQSRAGGASIADGAAAIASGQLLELLETIDDVMEDVGKADLQVSPTGRRMDPDALVKIAGALASLRTTEQNDVRLKQNYLRLGQKDQEIALERQKFQQATAGIALQILADDRAKQIESGAGTNEQKIEMMGQHIFGDLWKPA